MVFISLHSSYLRSAARTPYTSNKAQENKGWPSMGSRKRSARQKQVEAFKAQLASDLDEIYARARAEHSAADERRENAYRAKSCESKNRYATRWDAQEAIASCAAHGRGGLTYYRCDFCGGWHLTSHPR